MRKIPFTKLLGITTICLQILTQSCKGLPDPDEEIIPDKSFYFLKNGDEQRGLANSFLSDSISIILYDYLGDKKIVAGNRVYFELIKGEGFVDQQLVLTNHNGYAGTRWKLGDKTNSQIVRASIYKSDGYYLNSLYFNALGFRYNIWDTINTSPEVNMQYLASHRINRVTFMTDHTSTLYKQGNYHFDWLRVNNAFFLNARQVEIDSTGNIWVGNWRGEIFKSIDNGSNWSACTKPFSGYSGFFEFSITSDGYIWATAPNYNLRYSADGGNTWVNTTLPINEKLGEIYRLSDNRLLLLSLNTQLFRSSDNFQTWVNLNAPGYPLNLYVTENDVVILINQQNNRSILRSTNAGDNFTLVYSTMPYFSGWMRHGFHKWGNTYYVLVQGKNILKTTDFQNFEEVYTNLYLYDMFVDHRGTLMATTLNKKNFFYFAVE